MNGSEKINDTSCNGYTNTKGSIYVDYNATTPLAPSVINEISKALHLWGNPSSSYDRGIKAKQSISVARHHVKQMLNGGNDSDVIFMSGGTESNNHVIRNSIKYFKTYVLRDEPLRQSKPHIITTCIEHDSILACLRTLEDEGEVDVTYIDVTNSHGYIDPEDVVAALREQTVLITIMMANNETGVVQPLREISVRLKTHVESRKASLRNPCRIFLHTDAAQAIGKIPVDVQLLGVDYLTVVGHKFYGPRIGALWVGCGCPIYPMMSGGGQESGKRAGTENTPMIVGLGEAARLVTEHVDEFREHMATTSTYLRHALITTFGEDALTFNSPMKNVLPNTVNVSFNNLTVCGRDLLSASERIEASVGAACHSHLVSKPSKILLAHGVSDHVAQTAIRLSVGRETSKEDVDLIVTELKTATLKCMS